MLSNKKSANSPKNKFYFKTRNILLVVLLLYILGILYLFWQLYFTPWKHYSNKPVDSYYPVLGISLDYPPTWYVVGKDPSTILSPYNLPSDWGDGIVLNQNNPVYISIVVIPPGDKDTPPEALDCQSYNGNFLQPPNDKWAKELNCHQITINGYQGIRAQSLPYTTEFQDEVWIKRSNEPYFYWADIKLITPPQEKDKYEPIFNQLLRSFRFAW